jgi:hypothetical protein
MEVENMLKNIQELYQTIGEEAPFIANRNRAVGGKSWANFSQKSVSRGSASDRLVHSPVSVGPAPEYCTGRGPGVAPVRAPDRPVYSPVTSARNWSPR